MRTLLQYFRGDRAIWTISLLLGLASILLVYSSIVTLAYKHHQGNTAFYLIRHGMFVLMGLGIIYAVHRVKYTYFTRLGVLLFYLSIPLLILTLAMGTNLNNASRWLVIPVINQSFQTSDLAKIGLIMFLARMLSYREAELKDFKRGFLALILPAAAVCILILPANFSTAAVLFAVALLMMFAAGVPLFHFLSLIPAGITVIATVFLITLVAPDIFPRMSTWQKRVERFISKDKEANREADYQVEQSKIAIATGGVTGKGPGNSQQRNFLPHPYSDFIYAIVLEEYGLFGGLLIISLYLVFFFRVLRIALRTEKLYARMLVFGIGILIVFQAFINMGVAVNLFPVTGQPLPLVSMGGTSTWFTCVGIGIILSVSRGVVLETSKTPKPEDFAIA
jgi:cell division protein FtsW